MSVSKSGTEVVISGGPDAVQAAARLLNQQIDTFLASGVNCIQPQPGSDQQPLCTAKVEASLEQRSEGRLEGG
jgi:hypothetical protein